MSKETSPTPPPGSPVIPSREFMFRVMHAGSRPAKPVYSYSDAIHLVRGRLGLGLRGLASRVRCSYSVLSKAEAGIHVPSASTLRAIAALAKSRGLENCENILMAEALRQQENSEKRGGHR